MVGINPETGHEQMASLNYTHGIAQALWQNQAVPHRAERPECPRYDQDPGFGSGDLLQAFSTVDLPENRNAFEDYDIDAARARGFGFARIQRYAIEHLLGVRRPERLR